MSTDPGETSDTLGLVVPGDVTRGEPIHIGTTPEVCVAGTTEYGLQPCEMPTELPATGAASFFIGFTASFIVSLGIVFIRGSRRSPR